VPYSHKTNHAEEGVSWLLTQHDNDVDLQNLVRALLSPYQKIENAIPGLRAAFDIDNIGEALIEEVTSEDGEDVTAEDGSLVWTGSQDDMNDQLTRLGAIVGEPRGGRRDSEYLPYVVARRIINRSKCEPSDLYAVARALLGESNALRLQRMPPAAYRLHVSGASIAFPWDATIPASYVAGTLADMLLEATGAGISLEVYFQTADDAHTFTFAALDSGEENVDQGFANDLGTQGGEFIGVESRQ
jgi:hypothetical protein